MTELRSLRRLLGAFAIALMGIVAVSCGSSGDSSFAVSGGPDASAHRDGAGDGPGSFGQGGAKCVPGTCASLGYTCGQNGDGCGGALDRGGRAPPPPPPPPRLHPPRPPS